MSCLRPCAPAAVYADWRGHWVGEIAAGRPSMGETGLVPARSGRAGNSGTRAWAEVATTRPERLAAVAAVVVVVGAAAAAPVHATKGLEVRRS